MKRRSSTPATKLTPPALGIGRKTLYRKLDQYNGKEPEDEAP